MNEQARKTLERIEREFGKARRSPRRWFSLTPFVLAFGLMLLDALLTTLVPMIHSSLSGMRGSYVLGNWERLIYIAVEVCQERQFPVRVGICGATLAAFLLSASGRMGRIFLWLVTVAVIALNALTLVVTIANCVGINV